MMKSISWNALGDGQGCIVLSLAVEAIGNQSREAAHSQVDLLGRNTVGYAQKSWNGRHQYYFDGAVD
ncbi:MAG: hypothetical protein GY938_14180 [Ketobacter sp.]|nr:hypothetical protein [Ketobacter sp.]